jgi:hypothetical protein
VAGAVGEFYALTFEEYTDVIRTALRAVAGRVPVLIGIGHSTRIAVELARCAAEEGAAGLLINPLYLAVPGDEGLRRHHEALAESADLGQVVFSTRGTPIGPDALERLAEVEHVVGLKDELGDLGLFLACVERLGERIAWIDGMAEPYASAYFAAARPASPPGWRTSPPRSRSPSTAPRARRTTRAATGSCVSASRGSPRCGGGGRGTTRRSSRRRRRSSAAGRTLPVAAGRDASGGPRRARTTAPRARPQRRAHRDGVTCGTASSG